MGNLRRIKKDYVKSEMDMVTLHRFRKNKKFKETLKKMKLISCVTENKDK